jgi:hypothetical protein
VVRDRLRILDFPIFLDLRAQFGRLKGPLRREIPTKRRGGLVGMAIAKIALDDVLASRPRNLFGAAKYKKRVI